MWDQFGEVFDFPEYSETPSTYMIACSPRTGSHLLASLLFQTQQLGYPVEYFHNSHIKTWKKHLNTESLEDTYSQLFRRRTSPTGWFGVKAHWPQFKNMVEHPSALDQFPFKRVIRLTRADCLEQAISLVIAKQTQAWISFQDIKSNPEYDRAAILKAMSTLERQDRAWSTWLEICNAPVTQVEYSELVESPTRILARIRDDFELSFDTSQYSMTRAPVRQATNLNSEWKLRFLEGA